LDFDLDVELVQLAELHDIVPYRRLMCMAYSLQLVIKKAYAHYDALLSKVRRLFGKMKKSSKMMGKLVKKTGKVILSDSLTRWNSTYRMAERIVLMRYC